jgi:hypothetical protein
MGAGRGSLSDRTYLGVVPLGYEQAAKAGSVLWFQAD